MPDTDDTSGSLVAGDEGKDSDVQLAAYKDILRPTARLVGIDLASFYRTIRRAVLNPEYKDVKERYRDFLSEVIGRVAPENLQTPPEQILGPVLEGKRYEPNGTPISDMFAELLSRACDRDRDHEAHPAFAKIIPLLSADEARILKFLGLSRVFALVDPSRTGEPLVATSDDIGVQSPQHLLLYSDHLSSLGLLMSTGYFARSVAATMHGSLLIDNEVFTGITPFGRTFIRAVSSPDSPGSV